MPTRSKLGSSHQGSSVFAVPIQEPKPNRSMMEPAEDWYRCDAADEDFFNSLLGLLPDVEHPPSRPRDTQRDARPKELATWFAGRFHGPSDFVEEPRASVACPALRIETRVVFAGRRAATLRVCPPR